MKIKLLDTTKTEMKDVELPSQFSEEVRPDLIKRAVHAIESHERQAYGADPLSGKRPSVEVSKRRRHYRGSYGIGISRVPRKVMSRAGTRFNFTAAFGPGTVGGRRAHPPKAIKVWEQKINVQERRKAIRSALAATMSKEIVANRGHQVPANYPFIVSSKIEDVIKTQDMKKILDKLGFTPEMERSSVKKVRAGKGKSRGRKYKKKTGLLLVVSKSCKAQKSAANIPGMDIAVVDRINTKLLAPGAQPGRITLFTEAAIERINTEKLFSGNKTSKTISQKIAAKAAKKTTKTESKSAKTSTVAKAAAKPAKKAAPVKKAEKTASKSKK